MADQLDVIGMKAEYIVEYSTTVALNDIVFYKQAVKLCIDVVEKNITFNQFIDKLQTHRAQCVRWTGRGKNSVVCREADTMFAKAVFEHYSSDVALKLGIDDYKELCINILGTESNNQQAVINQQQEKYPMITITHKTYVNGTDIKDLTDTDLFGIIAEQETAMEYLRKIDHQPQKLVKQLAGMEATIAELIKLIDERK